MKKCSNCIHSPVCFFYMIGEHTEICHNFHFSLKLRVRLRMWLDSRKH